MKARKIVDKILGHFVVFIMGLLVINVTWQVVSRYILNDPSSFSVELARYLLIWVGLFGAAYATGKKEHLAIELFPQKLARRSPEKKKKLDMIINILIALFSFFVLIIGGIRLVYITLSLNQLSPTLQIPLGYIYLCLPLSGLLIIFYNVAEILYGPPEKYKH